jgi:hypothetical protein
MGKRQHIRSFRMFNTFCTRSENYRLKILFKSPLAVPNSKPIKLYIKSENQNKQILQNVTASACRV